MKQNGASRVRQVALNYTVSMGKSVGVILIGLVSRGIFINKLGMRYIGMTALFESVISTISLANLGIGKALIYIMIPLVAENEVDKMQGLYKYSKKIFMVVGLAIFLLGVAAMPVLSVLVSDEDKISGMYRCYMIYLISAVITYASATKGAVFAAHHKMRVAEMASFLGYFLTTLLQVIILFVYPSYEMYLLMMAVGSVVSVIYVSVRFKIDFPEFDNHSRKTIGRDEKKKLYTRVKDMFFVRIFNTAIDSTDSLLITRFVGVVSLGIYNNYSIIFSNVGQLSKNIYNSMESVVGSISVEVAKTERYSLYKRELFVFHIIGTVLATGCYCLSQDFITLYMGKENLLPIVLVAICIVCFYVDIIQYAFAGFYNTGGYYSDMKFVFIASAIVNVVISIILAVNYGLLGVLLGTIISRSLVSLPGTAAMVSKKSFEKSMRGIMWDNIKCIIQMIIIAFVGKLFFDSFFVNNYFEWCIKGVCVVVYACVGIFMFNCKSEEYKYICDKVVNTFKKKQNNAEE